MVVASTKLALPMHPERHRLQVPCRCLRTHRRKCLILQQVKTGSELPESSETIQENLNLTIPVVPSDLETLGLPLSHPQETCRYIQ
jgi:hypothetical protein